MAFQLQVPRVGQKIVDANGGMLQYLWALLRQALGNPDITITTLVAGASPWTYQNTGSYSMGFVISGGTVSVVEYSRDGASFFVIATSTFQTVELAPGDTVRVTYSVLPSFFNIPR